jgi:DNA-directed RNA polymerase specialized sigma24 family protein
VSESGPEPSLDEHLAKLRELFVTVAAHESGVLATTIPAIGDDVAAKAILRFLLDIDEELAAPAFLRLIGALRYRTSEAGRDAPQIQSAEAYLRSIVRNLRIDSFRQSVRHVRTVPLIEEVAAGDPGADSEDASARLTMALQLAAAQGESDLVKFATTWLDLADELGRSPSSREVAQVLGVSHQTAINRLKALRRFL